MKQNGTKQNLIDVALPMLAENGVYGVSLRDIAKKAEINVSSVLYHFGSKEEFILTCGEECVRNIASAIKELCSREYESVDLLNRTIHDVAVSCRKEITICVMLLAVETSGFREVYELHVKDELIKVAGLETPYILNVRSLISIALFKTIDLRVANKKLEGSGMVNLLCQAQDITL